MLAILIAGAFALLGTLLGTRFAIKVLVSRGYGQLIRDDGPTSHHTKRGTPTMGGLVIILSVLMAYALAKLATGFTSYDSGPPSASAILLLFLFCGLGFAIAAIGWEDETGRTVITHAISFTRDVGWELPTVLLLVWVLVMIAGTSNGVNLTDGLDGLATGAATMVFGAYVFINIWQSNQNCQFSPGPKCYEVRDPLDLAIVASALTGACFGFLWWNASPAKIFMGDTGSLSIGGVIAGFALMTRTELLLIVVGGLFVAITASVILQVAYFKLTKGKRIFRMAPLQHHFELVGWDEITIVVRFWIIGGLAVITGLGIFYWEWVAGI